MRALTLPSRLGAAACAALMLALPVAGRAEAAAPVVQDSLAPTTMTAGTAQRARLTLHSGVCFWARRVGVAVRDAAGHTLDFPGAAANARICPGGLTVTTGARTLPVGTYTAFGIWQDYLGSWHNLAAQPLTVTAVPTPAPTPTPSPTPSPTPAPGSVPTGAGTRQLAWSEEFDRPIAWGLTWMGDWTSAYRYGNHNPADNKLDWLTRSAVTVAGGVATFTARPSGHVLENGRRAWTTGLLTTEGSSQGFQVRTGDYIETRVQLPTGLGAWPALWTWKDGNGEVDSFEYHPDNPNLLELTNHVRPAGTYVTDPATVAPGRWVTIGTAYGAESVDWYVDGVKVWSDGVGVGAGWSAYPILNLSVVAGRYHPAPVGSTPLTFAADYLRVYR
ncbi:hypothetical protein [Kitasatospora paranensis]|uniref:GH16 domain-containing protein n=1 Tax=Kitasatospora paranensis TaxID=258053 RepID=A0ABW2G5S8_9ACTN